MIIDDTNNCNNDNADDNAVAVDADNKASTSNIHSIVILIVILMMTVDIYIFLRLF